MRRTSAIVPLSRLLTLAVKSFAAFQRHIREIGRQNEVVLKLLLCLVLDTY
jgi:hypothetical protein